MALDLLLPQIQGVKQLPQLDPHIAPKTFILSLCLIVDGFPKIFKVHKDAAEAQQLALGWASERDWNLAGGRMVASIINHRRIKRGRVFFEHASQDESFFTNACSCCVFHKRPQLGGQRQV